jgi:hypothetical protein
MPDVVLSDDLKGPIPEIPQELKEAAEEQAAEDIKEVASAKEAVKSFQDLWMNLRYQHREKYTEYAELQASLSAMSFDKAETRVNFTTMNALRDEIVKIEGGLETLNLYRVLVLGEEAEPWLEVELKEKRKKIKVRTASPYSKKGGDYSKYANWEADATDTDSKLNKTV